MNDNDHALERARMYGTLRMLIAVLIAMVSFVAGFVVGRVY